MSAQLSVVHELDNLNNDLAAIYPSSIITATTL